MPESSNGTEDQEHQATEAQDAAAESSTADDGAKEGSMLEAVMAAVESKEPSQDSPTGEEEEGAADADKGPEEGSAKGDESDEAEGDDDKPPPFHEHPRWQEMLTENKQLKETAQRWNQFEQQLQQNGLTPDDVDQGAELMRLLRSDPAKAAEVLAPVMEQVQRFAGQGSLPDDLQQAVDAGQITEQYAKELAQQRTQSSYYANRTKEEQERMQREAEARAQQEAETARNAVMGAVNDWEAKWKSSDPDFEKKHRYVRDRVNILAREMGRPIQSAEEAIQLAEKARKQIDDELGSMLPRKENKRGTTKGGSSVSTAPEPKSLREVVEQAAARG